MRRVALIGFLCCAWALAAQPVPNPPAVSIIQLISTPERFSGKAVTVVGLLMARSERTILFLSAEDAKHYISNNGVWLHPGAQMSEAVEKLDGNYVLVVGTFAAYPPDSVHLSSGEIRNIRRIVRWGSADDSQRSEEK